MPSRILDIGTGTGLLALMAAQKTKASIDAVEIEKNSFEEAAENFSRSPWKDRLRAFHSSILDWESTPKFDLIISNPPFFEDDLRSPNQNRNLAKHQDGFTFRDLLTSMERNLTPRGSFAVILPAHRTFQWDTLASEAGYHQMDALYIRQTPRHPLFRTFLLYSRDPVAGSSGEMAIRNEIGSYTDPFKVLLKDYYLETNLFPDA